MEGSGVRLWRARLNPKGPNGPAYTWHTCVSRMVCWPTFQGSEPRGAEDLRVHGVSAVPSERSKLILRVRTYARVGGHSERGQIVAAFPGSGVLAGHPVVQGTVPRLNVHG
jgi:hypothetical protein